jgi:aryl sulfotransferase
MRWPQKNQELQNVVLDSTKWNDFEYRDDDVVIASWAKAGTTLTQQIVAQLVFDGDPQIMGVAVSPWIEFRLTPDAARDAQGIPHRRVLKTHLPLHALVFSSQAKYIYIGRDPRDVVWSMHHHHSIFSPEAYRVFNSLPGRVGPPLAPPNPDVRAYYHEWLDKDGYPFWPFWSHVRSWWEARTLPNVLLVHFADLRRGLASEIRRIGTFLGIEVDERLLRRLLENCSMEHMRRQADKVDFIKMIFEGGGEAFIHKGTNGRWRDVLSEAEAKKCDDIAARELPADCVRWLATGVLPER